MRFRWSPFAISHQWPAAATADRRCVRFPRHLNPNEDKNSSMQEATSFLTLRTHGDTPLYYKTTERARHRGRLPWRPVYGIARASIYIFQPIGKNSAQSNGQQLESGRLFGIDFKVLMASGQRCNGSRQALTLAPTLAPTTTHHQM